MKEINNFSAEKQVSYLNEKKIPVSLRNLVISYLFNQPKVWGK